MSVCVCVGAASRSFTSTAVNVVTRNERQKVRVERNPSKKGYMRLHTNLGDLNLELHCDLAPRTCENFFVLSEGGYYTDTIFHRSIKNFMIQVGLHHFLRLWGGGGVVSRFGLGAEGCCPRPLRMSTPPLTPPQSFCACQCCSVEHCMLFQLMLQSLD